MENLKSEGTIDCQCELLPYEIIMKTVVIAWVTDDQEDMTCRYCMSMQSPVCKVHLFRWHYVN